LNVIVLTAIELIAALLQILKAKSPDIWQVIFTRCTFNHPLWSVSGVSATSSGSLAAIPSQLAFNTTLTQLRITPEAES